MARPRTPKAKAKATGQDVSHADRFKDRQEPKTTSPLGESPDWFNEYQLKAWNLFQHELFWLNGSHRALMEIACVVRARLMTPLKEGEEGVGIQAMNLLRQCLGQMGATPADASKVTIPDGQDEKDPADKYKR
jgi:hypothetical protein